MVTKAGGDTEAGVTTPFRGEIWWTSDRSGAGEGDDARRPVLIIQNDVGNAHGRTVVAALIGSAVPEKWYPQMVVLHESLLGRPAAVRCDLIHTFDKGRLVGRAVLVPPETMAEVDAALRRSLGLR